MLEVWAIQFVLERQCAPGQSPVRRDRLMLQMKELGGFMEGFDSMIRHGPMKRERTSTLKGRTCRLHEQRRTPFTTSNLIPNRNMVLKPARRRTEHRQSPWDTGGSICAPIGCPGCNLRLAPRRSRALFHAALMKQYATTTTNNSQAAN